MVPRLDADALVDAVALHVPAGRVPLRPTSWPRTRHRGRHEPEYELLDTGIFDDDRYWEITADYAKATPDDLCIRVTVRNAGPETATLHVLPTLWFRNTWSWGLDDRRPVLTTDDGAIVGRSPRPRPPRAASAPASRELLFCENETNAAPAVGRRRPVAVPEGRHQRSRRRTAPPTVNPAQHGTKAALLYHAHGGAPGRPPRCGCGSSPDGGGVDADVDGDAGATARPRPTRSTPS